MADIKKQIATISTVVLMIVMFALIIGSILGSTVFQTITIINVSELSEQYGLAIAAITGFLVTIGTIVAVIWLARYIKDLFDKKSGIGQLGA